MREDHCARRREEGASLSRCVDGRRSIYVLVRTHVRAHVVCATHLTLWLGNRSCGIIMDGMTLGGVCIHTDGDDTT